MSRPIPELDIPNPTGACWTCVERHTEPTCDRGLPVCAACTQSGVVCAGYHARLKWPKKVLRPRPAVRAQLALSTAVSALGLPSGEDRLLQHFVKNFSRISVAVDYEGNGYRRFVGVSLNDGALLNAILGVSESHLNRWQRKKDVTSRTYIRKSLQQLQRRFEKPALLRSEITLMTIVIHLTYELCENNERWKQHFSGAISWIQCRKDCADIDPFIITLLSLIATQVLLHMHGAFREQSYQLLEALAPFWVAHDAVDVIYGSSVDLPRLIIQAAHLQDDFAEAKLQDDNLMLEDIYIRAEELQQLIQATQISAHSLPYLRLLGKSKMAATIEDLTPADPFEDVDIREAARASAEIFRHALQVFVYRILHDPMSTGGRPPTIQDAITECFILLPLIPDTAGPGSFLGWALVVIGAELDSIDQREHVKRRLESLTLLALNHGVLALQVLDEVWRRRDAIRVGSSSIRRCRWQEVLEDMEVDLAVI